MVVFFTSSLFPTSKFLACFICHISLPLFVLLVGFCCVAHIQKVGVRACKSCCVCPVCYWVCVSCVCPMSFCVLLSCYLLYVFFILLYVMYVGVCPVSYCVFYWMCPVSYCVFYLICPVFYCVFHLMCPVSFCVCHTVCPVLCPTVCVLLSCVLLCVSCVIMYVLLCPIVCVLLSCVLAYVSCVLLCVLLHRYQKEHPEAKHHGEQDENVVSELSLLYWHWSMTTGTSYTVPVVKIIPHTVFCDYY